MAACAHQAEATVERHAAVKHKTLTLPAALLRGHGFEIAQDAALKVMHLIKALLEQWLPFPANPTGAKQR